MHTAHVALSGGSPSLRAAISDELKAVVRGRPSPTCSVLLTTDPSMSPALHDADVITVRVPAGGVAGARTLIHASIVDWRRVVPTADQARRLAAAAVAASLLEAPNERKAGVDQPLFLLVLARWSEANADAAIAAAACAVQEPIPSPRSISLSLNGGGSVNPGSVYPGLVPCGDCHAAATALVAIAEASAAAAGASATPSESSSANGQRSLPCDGLLLSKGDALPALHGWLLAAPGWPLGDAGTTRLLAAADCTREGRGAAWYALLRAAASGVGPATFADAGVGAGATAMSARDAMVPWLCDALPSSAERRAVLDYFAARPVSGPSVRGGFA